MDASLYIWYHLGFSYNLSIISGANWWQTHEQESFYWNFFPHVLHEVNL